ncbi:MAG: hypothetical protein HDT27_04740 [Subdoligranulum sp.]|nr:hypothetical protein [Subdoligranulum sp.]
MRGTSILDALADLSYGLDALDAIQQAIASNKSENPAFAHGMEYVLHHFRADLDALEEQIEEETQG